MVLREYLIIFLKGVASNGIEAGLTLDISFRLECGLDGWWGVI